MALLWVDPQAQLADDDAVDLHPACSAIRSSEARREPSAWAILRSRVLSGSWRLAAVVAAAGDLAGQACSLETSMAWPCGLMPYLRRFHPARVDNLWKGKAVSAGKVVDVDVSPRRGGWVNMVVR